MGGKRDDRAFFAAHESGFPRDARQPKETDIRFSPGWRDHLPNSYATVNARPFFRRIHRDLINRPPRRLNWRFACAHRAIRGLPVRDSRTCETLDVERICFSPTSVQPSLRSCLRWLRGIERSTPTERNQVPWESFYADFYSRNYPRQGNIKSWRVFASLTQPFVNKVLPGSLGARGYNVR